MEVKCDNRLKMPYAKGMGCRGKQKKNMKPLASLTESSKGLHPLQSFKNGRNIIMKKMPYSKKKSNSTT